MLAIGVECKLKLRRLYYLDTIFWEFCTKINHSRTQAHGRTNKSFKGRGWDRKGKITQAITNSFFIIFFFQFYYFYTSHSIAREIHQRMSRNQSQRRTFVRILLIIVTRVVVKMIWWHLIWRHWRFQLAHNYPNSYSIRQRQVSSFEFWSCRFETNLIFLDQNEIKTDSLSSDQADLDPIRTNWVKSAGIELSQIFLGHPTKMKHFLLICISKILISYLLSLFQPNHLQS